MIATINPYKRFKGAFIPNAILEFPGLSQSAKLVWGRLAQFAGANGRCYPKIEEIASGVALSSRQAKRVLNELVENDFIQVVKPTGKRKLMHWPNEYLFLDHPCFKSDPKCTSEGDTSVPSGGVVNGPSKEVTLMSPPNKRVIQENHNKRVKEETGVTDFDIFWEKYPKKKSKGTARKVWVKINPGKKKSAAILNGLSLAINSNAWEKENGKYIPYPASWLNAEGWEDEDEETYVEPTDYGRQAKIIAADRERIRLLKEKKQRKLEQEATC